MSDSEQGSPAGGPAVTIRRATREDLAAMGRLGALLVEMHHDLDPERFIARTAQTEAAYVTFLGTQLDDSSAVLLVAALGGEVIAYTYGAVEERDYMSLRGPAGVLHDIVVDPDHRELGIGRALLGATLAMLEAQGAPRVIVSAAARNDAARRLFAGAGFRETMTEMTREAPEG